MSSDEERYDGSVAGDVDRSVKACDACHRAKSRCGGDGYSPCPACERRGIQCVYSAAKKRGPKSGALAELKAEVAALRAQLAAQQHHDAVSSGSSSSSAAAPGPAKRRKTNAAHAEAAPVPQAPSSAFVPFADEPPLTSHEAMVNHIRLYFTRHNPILPMLCKERFYFCGMRLQVWDLMASVCENARPVCNHAAGDCAQMAFSVIISPDGTPLSNAPTAPSVKRATLLATLGTAAQAASESAPGSGSRGGRGGSSGAVQVRAKAPQGYLRATPALINAHLAQLPAHIRSPAANTPTVLSACKACLYGVLAIGARLDMQFSVADAYAARARAALSVAFDEPCQETISAALLLGYYAVGTAADGDMLRAKCYISLANEMADGLENTPAAIRRRAVSNAFSTTGASTSTSASAAAASAPSAGSGLSLTVSTPTASSESSYSPMAFSSSAPSTPLSTAASADVPTGVPLDILLSVRFLAQMISAYRSGPESGVSDRRRGEEWATPRGRVSRILAFVTERTRRKISTPESLRMHAPELLRALDDAEAINTEHRLGGAMDFSTQAAIHTSRAVVLHACGDYAQAQAAADRAMQAMNTPLRVYSTFMTTSVFVQLIPVLMAGRRLDAVNTLITYLRDVAAMWPVGRVLVEKSQRRIQYCQQQQQQMQMQMQLAGVPTAAFRQIGASSSSESASSDQADKAALFLSAPGKGSSSSSGGHNLPSPGAHARRGLSSGAASDMLGSSSSSSMPSAVLPYVGSVGSLTGDGNSVISLGGGGGAANDPTSGRSSTLVGLSVDEGGRVATPLQRLAAVTSLAEHLPDDGDDFPSDTGGTTPLIDSAGGIGGWVSAAAVAAAAAAAASSGRNGLLGSPVVRNGSPLDPSAAAASATAATASAAAASGQTNQFGAIYGWDTDSILIPSDMFLLDSELFPGR
jgi:hypothetical protein